MLYTELSAQCGKPARSSVGRRPSHWQLNDGRYRLSHLAFSFVELSSHTLRRSTRHVKIKKSRVCNNFPEKSAVILEIGYPNFLITQRRISGSWSMSTHRYPPAILVRFTRTVLQTAWRPLYSNNARVHDCDSRISQESLCANNQLDLSNLLDRTTICDRQTHRQQ